jgi:hypothetical protein
MSNTLIQYKKIYDKGLHRFLVVVIIMVVIITGCTSEETTQPPIISTTTPNDFETISSITPEPVEVSLLSGTPINVNYGIDQTFIRLPDGSEIILGQNTEIEMSKIFGLTTEVPEHEIVIHNGSILVDSLLDKGEWFTILNPEGNIARVTGSVMVVTYDAKTGKFCIDCIEGDCEFGPNDNILLDLTVGEQLCFVSDGTFQGPFDVNMDELRKIYGDKIPAGPPSPVPDTATPEPPTNTPDTAATATAACGEYEEQFPGTPCP